MPDIVSVGEAFDEFCHDGHNVPAAGLASRLELLANGFEGWLKIEFLFWLVERKGLRLNTDVGVEYRVDLDERLPEVDRGKKLCDMWIRARDSKARFHYLELKAPFANQNQTKLLRSAGYDFWYMRRLAEVSEPASGNALVLGVGFEDTAWSAAEELVATAAGCNPDNRAPQTRGTLGSRIQWAVWTHLYP